MGKVFLTGAKGFLGSHLSPKLIEKGYDVITDMRYFDTERYDAVIHLAAVTHIRPEFDAKLFESNIIYAKRIMSTPHRLLYASSCSAAHDLTNPYAQTKMYAEYLGGLHPNSLGLRFFNVFGNRNNKGIVWFLLQKKDGEDVAIRGANLVRDYVHVDDVVSYIMLCLTYQGIPKLKKVIDVGTGVGTKTIDLVKMFEELSGRKFNIMTAPANPTEPEVMISSNSVVVYNLPEKLKQTIETENAKGFNTSSLL